MSIAPRVELNGHSALRIEFELPRGPTAPARARTETRRAIAGRFPEVDAATVALLTSELVTNAVVHAEQPDDTGIGLRISSYEDRLCVEVIDSGTGFDASTPFTRRPEHCGTGLFLVECLASRWGAAHRGDAEARNFCVWFELDGQPPPAAA
jgi:anti-sigma regulatory factor (Ser/Thr protein kinase)